MKNFFVRIWKTIQLWIEIDGTFVATAVSFYAGRASSDPCVNVRVWLAVVELKPFARLGSKVAGVCCERAFHCVWQTSAEPATILVILKRILFFRLRAFLMLLGIVFIVVLNFAANISIEMFAQHVGDWVASERVWRWVHVGASVLLYALMFTSVYQAVPKEKVYLRHAIQGGILTACSWEIGRYVLATLVVNERYNAFGVVGVFWRFCCGCFTA